MAQINLVESILSFIVVVVLAFLLITWLMSFIRFSIGVVECEDGTDGLLAILFYNCN